MRIKTCQVCGKQYDACKTPIIAEGFFQWQDVACSPSCATKYLAQMEKDAKAAKAPKKDVPKAKKSAPKADDKVEAQPE